MTGIEPFEKILARQIRDRSILIIVRNAFFKEFLVGSSIDFLLSSLLHPLHILCICHDGEVARQNNCLINVVKKLEKQLRTRNTLIYFECIIQKSRWSHLLKPMQSSLFGVWDSIWANICKTKHVYMMKDSLDQGRKTAKEDQWLLGVTSVLFDIDQGQTIENLYPPNALSPEEQRAVAFHSNSFHT